MFSSKNGVGRHRATNRVRTRNTQYTNENPTLRLHTTPFGILGDTSVFCSQLGAVTGGFTVDPNRFPTPEPRVSFARRRGSAILNVKWCSSWGIYSISCGGLWEDWAWKMMLELPTYRLHRAVYCVLMLFPGTNNSLVDALCDPWCNSTNPTIPSPSNGWNCSTCVPVVQTLNPHTGSYADLEDPFTMYVKMLQCYKTQCSVVTTPGLLNRDAFGVMMKWVCVYTNARICACCQCVQHSWLEFTFCT